jgi:hypothetical protein
VGRVAAHDAGGARRAGAPQRLPQVIGMKSIKDEEEGRVFH